MIYNFTITFMDSERTLVGFDYQKHTEENNPNPTYRFELGLLVLYFSLILKKREGV